AAMRAAGLSASTPDPDQGRVVRGPDGSPSGAFYEAPAQRLVARSFPDPSEQEFREAAEAGAQDFARRGFVAVHTMALEDDDALRAVLRLERVGRLPLRVWACLGHADLAGVEQAGLLGGLGDRVRAGGIKFFADGALGSRTAAMLRPYATGGTGLRVDAPELIEERARRAIKLGFTPTVHAIGDAANRDVISVFERLAPAARLEGVRLRLEHAQHLNPEDVPRLAATGAVASVQPIHLPGDTAAIRAVMPGEREGQAYAFRSLLEAGVPLALGSDAPVAEPTVAGNLEAASRRLGPDGVPFHEEQSIPRLEALRAYTRGGAFAAGEEGWSGRVAPGFLAEFTVWDADPVSREDARPVRALVWPEPV
ncbi:MAG TPA: amidohydrolase family protein, partial [Deinococcales bacterium]|nr:amidohydrolase family protein [Deinococcales bacterium]